MKYLPIGAALLLAACSNGSAVETTTTTTTTINVQEEMPYVIVAVGDIACSQSQKASASEDECQEGKVVDLIQSIDPDQVLLLGDIQYNDGTEFTETFAPLWGDLLSRSYPVLGNHEYASGAGAFFEFFPQVPDTGYYYFNSGDSLVLALNTNCSEIDCDAQNMWIQNALYKSNRECVIAMGHHPRFSSGNHGDNSHMEDMYQSMDKFGVDVYVAGHDHHYEYIDGLVPQVVAGTGGRSLRSSQNGISEYGVVKMTIQDAVITLEFIDIQGATLDSHQIMCDDSLPGVKS
jgi:hypothetical protein